jgi:hypothetical protein
MYGACEHKHKNEIRLINMIQDTTNKNRTNKQKNKQTNKQTNNVQRDIHELCWPWELPLDFNHVAVGVLAVGIHAPHGNGTSAQLWACEEILPWKSADLFLHQTHDVKHNSNHVPVCQCMQACARQSVSQSVYQTTCSDTSGGVSHKDK